MAECPNNNWQEKNSCELKKSLGLPANASDKEVDEKMKANNATALRESLGLPANASDKEVDEAFLKKIESFK